MDLEYIRMFFRPFTTIEYSSYLITKKYPHNGNITVKVSERINPVIIKDALSTLMAKSYINLSLTILENKLGFFRLRQVPEVTYYVGFDCWSDFAEHEINMSFSYSEPLIRLSVLEISNNYYLSISFHHIIGDGISGFQLLNDILKIYNEEKVKRGTLFLQHYKVTNLGEIPLSKVSKVSKVSNIIFLPDEAKWIIKMSLKHNVSLNSYVSSCIINAMANYFRTVDINLSMPVNLRSKLKPINDIEYKTSWIEMEINNIYVNDVIKLSRLIKSSIKGNLVNRQHISNIRRLSQLIKSKNSNDLFLDEFKSKKSTAFISNMFSKRCILAEKKYVSILEAYVSVSTHAYMATHDSLTYQGIMLDNDYFNINMNYTLPHASAGDIHEMGIRLKKNLISGLEPHELNCQSAHIDCE